MKRYHAQSTPYGAGARGREAATALDRHSQRPGARPASPSSKAVSNPHLFVRADCATKATFADEAIHGPRRMPDIIARIADTRLIGGPPLEYSIIGRLL